MPGIDPKVLLQAGAHFGHKTSRWHPKMKPYIYGKRGDIYIIDLIKTSDMIDDAVRAVEAVAASGGSILFVGTKRQAREIVREAAAACDMPYVTQRWLGGMLTNFQTISKRVSHLKKLEKDIETGELAAKYSKLEVQRANEEIESLNNVLGGIKTMDKTPSMVFILDVHMEDTATREAIKLDIPVIGIVDTNADPSNIDYPIPANDDAIESLKLIANAIADAVKKGKSKASPKAEPSQDDV